MKRGFFLLFLLCYCFFCSFTHPVLTQMERLVSKIEVKYEKWDKTQRKEARKEYSALLKKCEQKYDSFSESEKDQLNSLIGRYCGFMAKHGFDQVKDAVIRTGERLPKMAEGFKDGLEK